MADDIEVLVALTRTGEIVDSLPVTGWSWEDSVSWSDTGSASVTVPLTGRGAADRAQVQTLRSIVRAPWALSLILLRDQRAQWAGPAVTLRWSGEEATVGCTGLPALFDRRILVTAGYWDRPWRYEANVHLELGTRDLVIELLRQGSSGGTGRDLPLLLPTPSGQSGPPVDYLGSDLGTIHERVDQAVKRDDGPDVLFTPDVSLSRNQLRWVVRVGEPRIGSTDSRATFDLPGSVLTLTGDIDASESVRTAYVVGEASGDSRLIGVAITDPDDITPALERADRTSVSERRQEQLDALARAYATDHALPAEAWSVTVDPTEWPLFGVEWGYGDVVTLGVDGHPWLDDGDYPRRIIGVKADPDSLTLDIAAHAAEVGT